MSVANSGSAGKGKDTIKPFELIIGEAGGEVLNGDIPVRWCVTPELVKDMEDAGINDPHILLISYRKNTNLEMDRKLVPLTELMTYVRFSRAGEHTLASWIVADPEPANRNSRVHLKNRFLKKKKDYTEWVGGEEHPVAVLNEYSYRSCHKSVTIPAEAFGKEPPKWLKWFGNLWHEKGPVDQCSFRKRCILAFTLKWVPVLAWICITIIMKLVLVLFCFAIGQVRVPNYKQIFRPFDGSMGYFLDDVDWDLSEHPFTFKKDWDPERSRHGKQVFCSLLTFVPIFMFLELFVASLAADSFGLIVSLFLSIQIFVTTIMVLYDAMSSVMYYLMNSHVGSRLYKQWHRLDMHLAETGDWPAVIMGTALVVICAFIYMLIFSWTFQLIVGSIITIIAISFGTMKLSEHMIQSDLDRNDYTQIRELLCPRDPLNIEAKYDLIPPKQRTVHLWVAKVKNKICKPMQY